MGRLMKTPKNAAGLRYSHQYRRNILRKRGELLRRGYLTRMRPDTFRASEDSDVFCLRLSAHALPPSPPRRSFRARLFSYMISSARASRLERSSASSGNIATPTETPTRGNCG